MKNLVNMPRSKVAVILKVLDREGVLPKELTRICKNWLLRKKIVKLLKSDKLVNRIRIKKPTPRLERYTFTDNDGKDCVGYINDDQAHVGGCIEDYFIRGHSICVVKRSD